MDSIPSKNLQRKQRTFSSEHRAKLSAAKKGKTFSPEHRAKLSAAKKGKKQSPEVIANRVAKTRGQKRTHEVRARMSKSAKNRVYTKEGLQKMSEAKKGKTLSSEHRIAISHGTKGHIKTPEHRTNLSKAKKGAPQSEAHRQANSRAQTGKKMSEEAKRKIGDAGRGEKHWNWKGGRPRLPRYSDPRYSPWQMAVFGRDNFTCQHCGYYNAHGDFLNAHHIKRWNEYPELRFEVDNGLTLCRDCHKKEHGKKPRPKETIYCACGCGNPLKPDSVAYGHRFLAGHNGRGRKRPLSERQAISATLKRQRSRTVRDSMNFSQLRLFE